MFGISVCCLAYRSAYRFVDQHIGLLFSISVCCSAYCSAYRFVDQHIGLLFSISVCCLAYRFVVQRIGLLFIIPVFCSSYRFVSFCCSAYQFVQHIRLMVEQGGQQPGKPGKVREFHCWSGKMKNVTNLRIISELVNYGKYLKPAFEFCLY